MIAGLLQLGGKLRQLLGVGGVVAHHVLHEGHQLLHGGVLAVGFAAAAVLIAVVAVGVLALVGMGMGMHRAIVVGVGMLVGMGMDVGALMGVGVGVNRAVSMGMGMLVGTAGDMIVIQMHGKHPPFRGFSSIILCIVRVVKEFLVLYPHPRVAKGRKMRYNTLERKGGIAMSDTHEHTHDHEHSHESAHDHAYLHAHGIPHSHGHVHENQKAVVNRLSRAIGHLEKVKRMVEEGCDCSEVLVQLAAVRSALDNTGKVILKDHMRHCMVDAVAAGDQEAIEDLLTAIDKLMK